MRLSFQIVASLITVLLSYPAYADNSRVDELKRQIVDIASENNRRTDNFAEVRSELQPLVDELVSLTPTRTEAEKLPDVVGGWKNLWSDLGFGFGIQNNQIYQIVSPDGYYYNFSKSKFGRLVVTSFLRGEYEDQGEFLRIRFTSNRIRLGYPSVGTDLNALIERFENFGWFWSLTVPGPIGIQGNLENLYVDHDLRIVIGNSDGEEDIDLYILTRSDFLVE